MKHIARSLLILLLLYGIVFAVGTAYLMHEGAPLWSGVLFAVFIVGLQFAEPRFLGVDLEGPVKGPVGQMDPQVHVEHRQAGRDRVDDVLRTDGFHQVAPRTGIAVTSHGSLPRTANPVPQSPEILRNPSRGKCADVLRGSANR